MTARNRNTRGIIRRTVTIVTTTTWTIHWRDDGPPGEWPAPGDCEPEPAARLAAGQERPLLASESSAATKEGQLSNEVEESEQVNGIK